MSPAAARRKTGTQSSAAPRGTAPSAAAPKASADQRIEVRKTYKLYIGGAFPRSESGRTYEVRDSHDRFLANAAMGSRKDARDAVVAARGAFGKWSGATAYNRGQVLYRVAELMEGRRAQLATEVAAAEGLAMAGADFAVVRKRNNKSLKMSKHEIKEEFKSQEGDPHVRSQRRSLQMAMRRNRMMADVPFADVVIVNPTHVAVALRYDSARGAPRVVAKGGDHVAARIRAIAEENRIPMVADVPLARTLFKACEIGQEIPPDLYKAVATVLAFIMTLKKRGSAAGVHKVKTLALAS